jgi:hypothetical protein
MSAAAPGEIIAMRQVPHWIGFVGAFAVIDYLRGLLDDQLWLFILLVVLGLALVRLASKYARDIPTAGH